MDIKCFGIARDITKSDQLRFDINEAMSVAQLRKMLNTTYPELGKINAYMVAVNQEYAEDDLSINANDEVAIIPPVSGG